MYKRQGAAFKPAFLSMALDAGAVAFVCEESLVESLEQLAQESGAAMLVGDSAVSYTHLICQFLQANVSGLFQCMNMQAIYVFMHLLVLKFQPTS